MIFLCEIAWKCLRIFQPQVLQTLIMGKPQKCKALLSIYLSSELFPVSFSRSITGDPREESADSVGKGGGGGGGGGGKKCSMYADSNADWAALVKDGDQTVGLGSLVKWFDSDPTIPGYLLFWGKKLSDLCKWLNQTRSGSIWLGRENRGMKYRESRHVTCPSGFLWGSWRIPGFGVGEQFLSPLFCVNSDQWRGGLSLHEAFSCLRHLALLFWNQTCPKRILIHVFFEIICQNITWTRASDRSSLTASSSRVNTSG